MSTKIVDVEPFSDGDRTHRPKEGWALVERPDLYLRKLAQGWMDHRGEARYGVQYKLDRLPDGYGLFERPRPKDHKIIDRYLYGHPSHKFFDSPNRFLPHFIHLMERHSNQGCTCTICTSRNSVKLSIGSGPRRPESSLKRTEGPVAQQAHHSKRVTDDEGTPDTLRLLLDRLKREGELTAPYEEPMSMDWRAEHDILKKWLDDVQDQQSWVPRKGELVLFARDLGGEISYHQHSKQYLVYNTEAEKFVGPPKWQAAVVGQVPEEPLFVQDLVCYENKKNSLTTSGFRVEPYPDPNEPDKRLSKMYKYVPLHHIRPFVLWNDYLAGIPASSWDDTILHAMKAATSVSLLDKFEFSGTWPNASILCRAVYVGHELICLGDAVRILPRGDDEITEILLLETIKFNMENLDKASDNDNDDGHPYNSKIVLSGKLLTLDKSKAASEQPLASMELTEQLPRALEGYGDWYPRHDMNKSCTVTFSRVLGRCFERNAMLLWLPSQENTHPKVELNKGLAGILRARGYSSENDERIQEGKTWYWGDSRADALDLDTVNGVEVSGRDKTREEEVVSSWRAALRLIDKKDNSTDRHVLQQATGPSERRPMGKSKMTKAAYDTTDVDSDNNDRSRRRSDSMDIDDPEPSTIADYRGDTAQHDSSSSDDALQARGRLMETFRTSKKPRLQPQVIIDKPVPKDDHSIVVIDSDEEND